jgi:hypothetical protein
MGNRPIDLTRPSTNFSLHFAFVHFQNTMFAEQIQTIYTPGILSSYHILISIFDHHFSVGAGWGSILYILVLRDQEFFIYPWEGRRVAGI